MSQTSNPLSTEATASEPLERAGEDDEARFRRYRQRLIDDCRFGAMYLRQWIRIVEGLRSPTLSHVGFHFFNSTVIALQQLSYVCLGYLTDTHKDSLNMRYFLNWVENHQQIFPSGTDKAIKQGLLEDRRTIDALSDQITNVKELRDKFLAHRDRNALGEDLDKHALNIQTMKRLYDTFAQIVNRYSGLYDNSGYG